MKNVIPHIELFHELDSSIAPILSILEPLYAYLYSLNTKSKRNERLKPSGFYFLLDNTWDKESALDVLIDLHKDVCCLLVILSEIERRRHDFSSFPNINNLITTSNALKSNIFDISPIIIKIKDSFNLIDSKSVCKKLFLYTESVRALLEEFASLKSILLEESMNKHNILLTKEPLHLKGDLE